MTWELNEKDYAVNHVLKVDVAWDKCESALGVGIGRGSFTLIPIEVIKHLLENNGYSIKETSK